MSKILGDYIGFKESLEDEFKEFMFKINPELFFTQTQINSFVKTGVLDEPKFNSFVCENLKQYLQIYLPKYISGFGNSKEVENGYLYMGVNNSGELTGIPFIGNLSLSFIQDILNSVKNLISIENDSDNIIRDELFKNIHYEFIPLSIDMSLLEDDEEELIKLETDFITYVKNYQNYIEKRNKWLDELQSFTNKISYIILDKDIRKDIANYILENSTPNRFWIADLLVSDEPIEILNGIQLADYRNNDNSVYYWIMFYKDYIVEKIRKRKPLKPTYVYGNLDSIYLDHFRCLTKLRRKFILQNSKLTYTVLKFYIPGRTKNHKNIYYSLPNDNENWHYRVRKIGIQGPCCI